MEQPSPPAADDHLNRYMNSIASLSDPLGRLAREQRLLAEEWQELAGRLRALAAGRELPVSPG